jgi:hypothetical protein
VRFPSRGVEIDALADIAITDFFGIVFLILGDTDLCKQRQQGQSCQELCSTLVHPESHVWLPTNDFAGKFQRVTQP